MYFRLWSRSSWIFVAKDLAAPGSIKIDFLQLSDYAAIANAGVRVFLCFIPILSTFPLMGLYADDPSESVMLMQIMLFSLFSAVVVLLPYAYPVWILRNRIRDKKLAEMDQITRSLRGDKEVVKTITIQGLLGLRGSVGTVRSGHRIDIECIAVHL